MIVIGLDAARMIRETISHGNDYLRQARVIIAPRVINGGACETAKTIYRGRSSAREP